MSLNQRDVDPDFTCDDCEKTYTLTQLSENEGSFSCPECGKEIYSTQA